MVCLLIVGVSRDLLIKSNMAAIQKRYAELGAAQQSPAVMLEQPEPTSTQNDICAYASWDGVVQNLADLFVCDQGRAIASLSAGRQVDFHVTSVAFSEGKLYAKTLYRIRVLMLQADLYKSVTILIGVVFS